LLDTVSFNDAVSSEEIEERIAAGNRAFHVHKKLFSSKLISRNAELQLYNTLIRPTVTLSSLIHYRRFRRLVYEIWCVNLHLYRRYWDVHKWRPVFPTSVS